MHVLSLLCFAICSLSSASAPLGGETTSWSRDYDETVERARQSHRPLLLVLENGMESDQQLQLAEVIPQSEEAELMSRFELCRLDVTTETGRRIAEGYSVTNFPYALITNAKCERIVFRGAGQLNPRLWRKTLAAYGGQPRVAGGFVESGEGSISGKVSAFQSIGFSKAQRAARRHHRPLIVYVSTDNCPYCEKMQRDTLDNPEVLKEVQAGFESVMVDRRDERDLAEQHGLRLFPTTLVFGADGKLIDRIEGYVKPGDFVNRLQTSRQDLVSGLW